MIVLGAQFKKVKEYYRNHAGKSFSILELDGVTFDMLQKLNNQDSTINYSKLKSQRKRIKSKIDKYAKSHTHTEITSSEVYKIHKKLNRQYTTMKEFYKGSGPKRIIEQDENEKKE